jgi:hypothetical protein
MLRIIEKIRGLRDTEPSRYNWNTVESGVKHHNPNPRDTGVNFKESRK